MIIRNYFNERDGREMADSKKVLNELRTKLRCASIAQIGGFLPPANPMTSWFGKGCLPVGELLPVWNGKPLFPLLQIRISELPFCPPALDDVEMLVLFHNDSYYRNNGQHGDGWMIKEFQSLKGLQFIPTSSYSSSIKPFPIHWLEVDDDAPGWEDAWEIVDLDPVNKDENASDAFFDEFNRYSMTKVGGYPTEIQHGVGNLDEFVFQVGSEEKPNWMWGDNGIGYFFKSPTGEWRWSYQCY